jgi:tetratricopeptide (TPR) repeat protein
LIQARLERHLWAQSYERDLAGILALQSEMAQAVANQIKVALTPEERVRLAQARTVNAEAYEAYVKGRFLWNERTDENVRKSVEYLEKAAQKDPTYAMAHAALAQAYTLCAFRGLRPHAEAHLRARAAAQKAIELDNSLGEAHAALAGVQADAGVLEAAAREFRRAIELDPNSITARVWYAELLTEMARHDDALRELRRALEIDPVSYVANSRLGEVLYYARHYDESLTQYRQALELYPSHPNLYWGLWHSYFEKGMYDDAVAALLKAVEFEKTPPAELAAYEKAYRDGGIRNVLRHRLQVLKRKGARPWAIACNYARLGEKDEAVQSLQEGFGLPAVRFTIRVDPCLDNVRVDPRFQDLLRRLNLPSN